MTPLLITGEDPQMFLPSWTSGRPCALDFAITPCQRLDRVADAARADRKVAIHYEDFKRRYLDTELTCNQQGIDFVPMIFEATGGMGPVAEQHLRSIAKLTAQRSGQDTDKCFHQFLETLSVCIRRAGARAVLRRSYLAPEPMGLNLILARDALRADSAASAAEEMRQRATFWQ